MPDEQLLTYADAIRLALHDALQQWPDVMLIGEGVPDPKEIFATTHALQQKFGLDRVQDMPIAENGLTGICIGAALGGMRPIMVHQRIDFVLLAMDQIINNAAKWHYMFNGQQQVPLVIRLIIGRGWGQGPQHSQSLQKLFALIPGLKVFMPATVSDAYHMMMKAVRDNNPVLYIEHRWLHSVQGYLTKQPDACLEKAEIVRHGSDITIVTFSYMLIEASKAADYLQTAGVSVDIISIRHLTPIDVDTIEDSVRRSGHLIIADNACRQASMGHDIISELSQRDPLVFRSPPRLIAWPDHPVPTSHFLAEYYYPGALDIAEAVLQQLELNYCQVQLKQYFYRESPSDVPDKNYTGSF